MRQIAFQLFRPILAGATLPGRLIGCLGAVLAICVTGLFSASLAGGVHLLPLIVAPIGASAVLLFAVPASPLAQPWPVIGGNVISTLVGIAVARLVPDPYLASGLAVGLAILAMSLLRCLHPPGGAAALTAVIGGPAVVSSGFLFALLPVGLNSVLMVLAAIGFHRLARTAYPHRPKPPTNPHGTTDPPSSARLGFTEADIDAALKSLDETFDIDKEDLSILLRRVALQVLDRDLGSPRCTEIMSRDVITIGQGAWVDEALHLLLLHKIRTLPVLDEDGRLAGTIGLRELAGAQGGIVRDRMSQARTASPEDRATSLLPVLTDGRHHAIVVVTATSQILGIVTQTDLLGTLFRPARGFVAAPTPPPTRV